MRKNNHMERFLLLMRSLLTGFIGGLLWGTLWIVAHYFNFTEVTPKTYLLSPWKSVKWINGWGGDVITILLVAFLSVVIAFIYYGLLKRFSSMWVGVVYGILMWGIFFIVIHPLFPSSKQFLSLSKETVVTTFCLFVLYGTFIGYSISFDYYDTFLRKKGKSVG